MNAKENEDELMREIIIPGRREKKKCDKRSKKMNDQRREYCQQTCLGKKNVEKRNGEEIVMKNGEEKGADSEKK